MLEKLFEGLDEKVFTLEARAELQENFLKAIEEKSQEMADAVIAEKTSEMEEECAKKVEEAKVEVKSVLEAEMKEAQAVYEAQLAETFEDFAVKAIEDFVTESKFDIDKSTEDLKAKALIEAFESMILVSGIDVMKIQEAKDETMAESKLGEITAKYDALVLEHLEMNRKLDESMKTGLITELSEGMTLLESEKFKKAAGEIAFTESKVDMLNSLKVLAETCKGTAVTEVLEEKAKVDEPSWKHFV